MVEIYYHSSHGYMFLAYLYPETNGLLSRGLLRNLEFETD